MRNNPLLKNISFFVIAFALFILSGCGGGGGGGGSSSNTVRGVVSNSLTGDKGVEGVNITIGGVTAKTRTRDNFDTNHPIGYFEMQNVKIGVTTALIEVPGGAPQIVAFNPGVTSGVNQDLELFINIGQVSGQILLPDGKSPAASAFVTVTATGETTQADTKGHFLLSLIPPGATQILAVNGSAAGTKSVNVAYGNTDLGTLILVDDPNTNPPGQPFTLTGTITVPGLGAVANTTVVLFRNQIQQETAVTDSKGRYYFYVPVGSYTVKAIRASYKDAETPTITLTDPSVPVITDLTMEAL